MFESTYQNFLKMTKDERMEIATASANRIYACLIYDLNVSKEAAVKFIIAVISIFAEADEKITDSEVEIFNKLFGQNETKESLKELTKNANKKDFVNHWDKMVDKIGGDIKRDFIMLGLAFISSDGVINNKEKDIFLQIIR